MRGCRRVRPGLCLCILLSIMVTLLVLRVHQKGVDGETTVRIRMMGPLAYDDPQLLHLVSRSLYLPSTQPSILVADQPLTHAAKRYLLYRNEFAYKFCQKMIKKLFQGVRNGFFVEAGALDGEFLSNTLPLEREAGWTGLLVEADGNMFEQLIRKRRRAWASHSCLAIHPHPHMETLVKFVRHSQLTDEFSKHSARAHGALLGVAGGATLDNSAPGHQVYEPVQCLPLASLLLALNITRVDLVSLDVEGAEVGVLRHFPWGRVSVDVWLVEHVASHPTAPAHSTPQKSGSSAVSSARAKVDQDFIDLFTTHGYDMYTVSDKLFIPNYVFILRGSKPHTRLRRAKQRLHSL